MTAALGMIVGCVGTAAAASLAVSPALRSTVWLGMLAPLVVTVLSWLTVERAFRRNPLQVTNVLVVGFGAKMLVIGVYVAVMLRVVLVPAIPFVASFTAYFVGLYAAEAWCLRRLFAGTAARGR